MTAPDLPPPRVDAGPDPDPDSGPDQPPAGDPDPWLGIPAALRDRAPGYDTDSAGGCG